MSGALAAESRHAPARWLPAGSPLVHLPEDAYGVGTIPAVRLPQTCTTSCATPVTEPIWSG